MDSSAAFFRPFFFLELSASSCHNHMRSKTLSEIHQGNRFQIQRSRRFSADVTATIEFIPVNFSHSHTTKSILMSLLKVRYLLFSLDGSSIYWRPKILMKKWSRSWYFPWPYRPKRCPRYTGPNFGITLYFFCRRQRDLALKTRK